VALIWLYTFMKCDRKWLFTCTYACARVLVHVCVCVRVCVYVYAQVCLNVCTKALEGWRFSWSELYCQSTRLHDSLVLQNWCTSWAHSVSANPGSSAKASILQTRYSLISGLNIHISFKKIVWCTWAEQIELRKGLHTPLSAYHSSGELHRYLNQIITRIWSNFLMPFAPPLCFFHLFFPCMPRLPKMLSVHN